MKDGLTRSDLAFLKRTAMTGDHPWALRVWTFIQQHEDAVGASTERMNYANEKWRAAQAEVDRLRGLIARIEMELKHPQMDGSQVPRAIVLCEQRRLSQPGLREPYLDADEPNPGVS